MLRTGREYLDQIRRRRIKLTVGDARSREIQEPALLRQAMEVARYYDLQASSPAASVHLPTGERRGWVHHLPRTRDELHAKSDALLALARGYEGFLGRAPDYMGVLIQAYGSARQHFGEYSDNIALFAATVARHDLFVTHSTTALRARSGPSRDLEIVEDGRRGLVVRGARAMATSAPLSDEVFILPQPPGGVRSAATLVASIPVETEGLHFVCREPFRGRSRVASSYEESDCLAVFEDVFIPRQRIFVFDPSGSTETWRVKSDGGAHLCLQTNARAIAKLESLIGMARYASDVYGLESSDDFKAAVGRAIRDLGLLTACHRSAVDGGALNSVGVFTPDYFPLNAARVFFIEAYPRIIGQLRQTVGGELYHLFSTQAMESGAVEVLASQWGVPPGDIGRRERLTACLYDLLLSDFGTRQELYEAHYIGSERRNAIRMWDAHRAEAPAWDDARLGGAGGAR